ncbi:hypothetical protein ABIA32_001693 [Streptacidiphilus sp. MAP12-20]|uniref:SCO2583 family membrane protein n=1 Tax=Streptacidiphilus sp. MAP12-20 TaxID=3156299 RepID=UPI0035123FD7
MGGRAEPPEGGPEGGAGGEDEFRPVVFDESFIRAARIQELSASERLSGAHRSVRRRGGRGGLPRQALALMLLIGFAFATAVYMGVRHPYPTPVSGVAANLSVQIIPLQPGPAGIPTGRSSATAVPKPSGSVSGSTSGALPGTASGSASPSGGAGASAGPTSPSGSSSPTGSSTPSLDPAYAGLPNGEFLAVGDTGFNLPNVRATDHFSHDQVSSALQTVQGYLRASSLNPEVLVGQNAERVREWISPGQFPQFNTSVDHPANDQLHEATGWMVRFDPTKVQLATDQVLVAPGKINYQELDNNTLQVTSDYTFLYALSPKQAASSSAQASASASATPSGTAPVSVGPVATPPTATPIVYFAVRRSLTYWLTPDDIAGRHVQLVDSVVQAGATSCDADNSAYLQPLFPQQHASAKPSARPSTGATATGAPNGIDPFDHNRSAWTVCGQLSGSL